MLLFALFFVVVYGIADELTDGLLSICLLKGFFWTIVIALAFMLVRAC